MLTGVFNIYILLNGKGSHDFPKLLCCLHKLDIRDRLQSVFFCVPHCIDYRVKNTGWWAETYFDNFNINDWIPVSGNSHISISFSGAGTNPCGVLVGPLSGMSYTTRVNSLLHHTYEVTLKLMHLRSGTSKLFVEILSNVWFNTTERRRIIHATTHAIDLSCHIIRASFPFLQFVWFIDS